MGICHSYLNHPSYRLGTNYVPPSKPSYFNLKLDAQSVKQTLERPRSRETRDLAIWWKPIWIFELLLQFMECNLIERCQLKTVWLAVIVSSFLTPWINLCVSRSSHTPDLDSVPQHTEHNTDKRVVYLSFFLGRSWLVWPHFFLRQLVARGGRRACWFCRVSKLVLKILQIDVIRPGGGFLAMTFGPNLRWRAEGGFQRT